MLPEWKLVSGETLKIRKKKATFAIIFISIFIIIGIVTFSYLRLKIIQGVGGSFLYRGGH